MLGPAPSSSSNSSIRLDSTAWRISCWRSRLESCSSLIACCSAGVIARVWPTLRWSDCFIWTCGSLRWLVYSRRAGALSVFHDSRRERHRQCADRFAVDVERLHAQLQRIAGAPAFCHEAQRHAIEELAGDRGVEPVIEGEAPAAPGLATRGIAAGMVPRDQLGDAAFAAVGQRGA